MNPNNYDFLTAIRTLSAPSDVFRKATVIRASMRDPRDSSGSISITLMNFEVSDQNNNDAKVEDIFSAYIKRDMQEVFNYHSRK